MTDGDGGRLPVLRLAWVRVGVAVIGVGAVVAALLASVLHHAATVPGFCAGHTGKASVGVPYAVSLSVHGSTVTSRVDVDGRLWRAVGDHVTLNGLVPPRSTTVAGSIVLVNGVQATFRSPGAYAALLPMTKAAGCQAVSVARAGGRLPTGG